MRWQTCNDNPTSISNALSAKEQSHGSRAECQTDPSQSQTFDTTQLDAILFMVIDGSYDFCVHDFKFLDPAGNEVVPS